jgi:hypothetical protein
MPGNVFCCVVLIVAKVVESAIVEVFISVELMLNSSRQRSKSSVTLDTRLLGGVIRVAPLVVDVVVRRVIFLVGEIASGATVAFVGVMMVATATGVVVATLGATLTASSD